MDQSIHEVVDAEIMGFLVAGHINILFSQEDGCCPTCCGPCWALKELLSQDKLDDIVRVLGQERESQWWDTVNDEVDRDWLKVAWRVTECHQP